MQNNACPLADWRRMVLEHAADQFPLDGVDPSVLIEALNMLDGDTDIEDDEREDEPIDIWFDERYQGWIPEYALCRCCGSLTLDGWTL